MAQFLVPRIRAVPEASRSLLPWDEGIGRHQVGACTVLIYPSS